MIKTREYFDNWAKSYDKLGQKYPFFLSYLFDFIIDKLNLNKNPTVLDLGAGTGRLLLEIANKNKNCKFIGIDFSSQMVKKAKENFKKRKLKAKFLIGNMEKIDLKNNSVDYAVSFGAIHHVKDKDKLFKEVFRILKPKGKLVYGDSFEKFGDLSKTTSQRPVTCCLSQNSTVVFEHAQKLSTSKKRFSFQPPVKDQWKVSDTSKKFDKEYEQELEKLKKQAPEFAKRFSKSVWDTYNSLPKEIKEKHPQEYHIEPYKLKRLLQEIEFKKVKITPSPDYFAIVEGEK